MGTLTEATLGLGSIVFILAVCYWWAGGMCKTMGDLSETIYLLRDRDPHTELVDYEYRCAIKFRELVETKKLDEDVVKCIMNEYEGKPIHNAGHWLQSDYYTNERFRCQYGLDPDPKIIERIKKFAIFEGRDPEPELTQYLESVNQKRIESLKIGKYEPRCGQKYN